MEFEKLYVKQVLLIMKVSFYLLLKLFLKFHVKLHVLLWVHFSIKLIGHIIIKSMFQWKSCVTLSLQESMKM